MAHVDKYAFSRTVLIRSSPNLPGTYGKEKLNSGLTLCALEGLQVCFQKLQTLVIKTA